MLKMANSKRLGDVALVVVILGFLLTAVSAFFIEFDVSVGTSSLHTKNFNILESNVSVEAKQFEADLSKEIDNPENLDIDPTQLVDDRFDSTGGLLNQVSKNILTKFWQSLQASLPDLTFIFIFLASLVVIYITVLGVRFFMGDGRI